MMKFSPNAPHSNEASSGLLRAVWATVNPAHAVQKAAAIVMFDEEITSFTVRKVVDAVRPGARAAGLVKEEPINSVLFQVGVGVNPHAAKPEQVGTAFQNVQGTTIVASLNITADSIRFETSSYTRWVAFREMIAGFIEQCIPIVAQTTTIKQIAVEYVDFFFARNSGEADAGLVIDRKSGSIASKAFSKREPFHSHCGWFERSTDASKRLVNVDVTANDANGPEGQRRVITIRTYEGEQVLEPISPRSLELCDPKNILLGMDALHLDLKSKLADVLTRDARAMISLGS